VTAEGPGEKRESKQPARCAICGKPVDPAYKPFCSKRCANVDLHRWLNSSYSIAGAPVDEGGDDDGWAPESPERD
jgi:endogenous inhibitor of DNA gyrase (YacG/DUF329 family)